MVMFDWLSKKINKKIVLFRRPIQFCTIFYIHLYLEWFPQRNRRCRIPWLVQTHRMNQLFRNIESLEKIQRFLLCPLKGYSPKNRYFVIIYSPSCCFTHPFVSLNTKEDIFEEPLIDFHTIFFFFFFTMKANGATVSVNYLINILQNILFWVLKLIKVLNNMRVSKWWQNVWLNYPFKRVKIR